MEIEYNLTLDDMKAFLRFHLKHGHKLKPLPLVRLVACIVSPAIVTFAGLAGWFWWHASTQWLSGCCAGVVVGFLVAVCVFGWLQKKILIPNTLRLYDKEECRWYFDRRRLKITVDGFEITNEFQQVRYDWSVVWLIDSTDEHVFFYVTLNQARIIPRRAFRDRRHFEEFIVLARQYQQGWKEPAPKSTGIITGLSPEATAITHPNAP
jgi:hypothetical protein